MARRLYALTLIAAAFLLALTIAYGQLLLPLTNSRRDQLFGFDHDKPLRRRFFDRGVFDGARWRSRGSSFGHVLQYRAMFYVFWATSLYIVGSLIILLVLQLARGNAGMSSSGGDPYAAADRAERQALLRDQGQKYPVRSL